MNELIILHSTPIKEFRDIIGQIVRDELKQYKPELSPQITNSEYITRQEVCNLLKISLTTLHSYTKHGNLKGYRIGGRVLYRRDEVQDAVQAIQANKYRHGRG